MRRLRVQGRRGETYRDAFNAIAMTRPYLVILPNLRILEWDIPETDGLSLIRDSPLFMHKDITRVLFSFHSSKDVATYIQTVHSQMPNLSHVHLKETPYRSEDNITELFSGIPRLQSVVIPTSQLAPKVIATLSKLAHLSKITATMKEDPKHGFCGEIGNVSHFLEVGTFPSLAVLDITIPWKYFASSGFMPGTIREFTIRSYSLLVATPNAVHDILSALANNCKRLQNISLQLLDIGAVGVIPADPVTFDALRPVLSLSQLTAFRIAHQDPIHLTMDDMEELASTCHALEVLDLNMAPLAMNYNQLPIQALLPFARHCPNMTELGLFLGATPSNFNISANLRPFRRLERLLVGTSDISNNVIVADFLEKICPAGVVISCRHDIALPDMYVKRNQKRYQKKEFNRRQYAWTLVQGLVELIPGVRGEGSVAKTLVLIK